MLVVGYKKTMDEAIRVVDNAKSDFQRAVSLLDEVDKITKKYGMKIDANALFNYSSAMKGKFKYYIDNADKGWYG